MKEYSSDISCKPKRNKRRALRALSVGPERLVISTDTVDGKRIDTLECGHSFDYVCRYKKGIEVEWFGERVRRCSECRSEPVTATVETLATETVPL